MKFKLLIFYFFLFAFNKVNGQQKNTIYYSQKWEICKKRHAQYYREYFLDHQKQIVGNVKTYYKTGELYFDQKMNYVDDSDIKYDIYNGLSITYFKTGSKEIEINLTNNKKDGTEIKWYPNGSLISKTSYEMGVKNGNSIEYDSNGTLRCEKLYKNGMLEGTATCYGSNGNVSNTIRYENDKLIEVICYDTSRNIVKCDQKLIESFKTTATDFKSSLEKDTIRINKINPFMGNDFSYRNHDNLGLINIKDELLSIPENKKYLNKADANIIFGTIIGVIGGFYLGHSISQILLGKEFNGPMLVSSMGVSIFSIPFSMAYEKNIRKAVNNFNSR